MLQIFQSDKIKKIIKYLISGCTAAVVNLGLLFVLTHLLHIWYIFSSILAFLVAFFVSFFLQKFWTFSNASTVDIHNQMMIYFIPASINLGINTTLMYLFVDFAHLHYMFAQIIASGLIAFESFFIYRWIFKTT